MKSVFTQCLAKVFIISVDILYPLNMFLRPQNVGIKALELYFPKQVKIDVRMALNEYRTACLLK